MSHNIKTVFYYKRNFRISKKEQPKEQSHILETVTWLDKKFSAIYGMWEFYNIAYKTPSFDYIWLYCELAESNLYMILMLSFHFHMCLSVLFFWDFSAEILYLFFRFRSLPHLPLFCSYCILFTTTLMILLTVYFINFSMFYIEG